MADTIPSQRGQPQQERIEHRGQDRRQGAFFFEHFINEAVVDFLSAP